MYVTDNNVTSVPDNGPDKKKIVKEFDLLWYILTSFVVMFIIVYLYLVARRIYRLLKRIFTANQPEQPQRPERPSFTVYYENHCMTNPHFENAFRQYGARRAEEDTAGIADTHRFRGEVCDASSTEVAY